MVSAGNTWAHANMCLDNSWSSEARQVAWGASVKKYFQSPNDEVFPGNKQVPGSSEGPEAERYRWLGGGQRRPNYNSTKISRMIPYKEHRSLREFYIHFEILAS